MGQNFKPVMKASQPLSDAELQYIQNRIYRMAGVIEAAERKLAGLYREAARYGMTDLLEHPDIAAQAWDREVAIEKLKAAARGEAR